jgi:predicted ester cyclase
MTASVEELKAIARRTWETILPSGDEAALREVIDPDCIEHGARPGEPQGVEGAIQTMHWLRRVFSEQRWEIHRVIGEGDTVVVHATHRGRHVGDLMGIPPTHREVAYDYVHIVRFRDRKAIEHWGVRDDMTLMRQLGVLPQPGSPAEAGQPARSAVGA